MAKVTIMGLSLTADGKPIDGPITRIDPMRCPHFIIMPSHYRPDDSCRCDDPTAAEMASWGYEWRNGKWEVASGSEDDDAGAE